MSIGFNMAGQIWDIEFMIETAKALAKERDYEITMVENGLCFTLCPMGELFLSWEPRPSYWLVQGKCLSTPAGPGFHKAAVEVIDSLGFSEVLVNDSSDYYNHRDFQRMRREHFFSWMKNVVNVCVKQFKTKEYQNISICWNVEKYRPENVDNTVITPMGRISLNKLIEMTEPQNIDNFAKHFFLWDSPQKDSIFYRNRALHLLWEQCYFMPSSRSEEDAQINSSILDDLETAYRMDKELPLPHKVYREVCDLDKRKPLIPEQGPELEEEFLIGYRRGLVTHTFGNLNIKLPGSYQYVWEEWDEGDGIHCWQNTPQDPVWHVNGYQIKEGNAHFADGMEVLHDLEEQNILGGKARWGWEERKDGEGVFYQLECEVVSGKHFYLIAVTYKKPEEKEEIVSLFRRLSAVLPNADREMFPFHEEIDTAALVCKHVLSGQRPILYVSHDEDDGMWQLLCGGAHGTEDGRIVSLEEAYSLDPSLKTLADMPCGTYATRKSKTDPWQVNRKN